MTTEPPAAILHYRVLHTGQVGQVVDVLAMEEVFGDWKEWFLECLRIRPRKRWQATWLTLRFEDGSEGAYRLSELERVQSDAS